MADQWSELDLSNRALLAAEDWAPTYQNAPKQHAQMIKMGATFQVASLSYLKNLAEESSKLIDWWAYSRAVIEQKQSFKASIQAYDVNVIVNNDAVSQQDQTFIKLVFDTVAGIQALGADSMEEELGFPVGLTSTSAIIQSLTTNQLANLVGMKVNKDGSIVPNPNPKYSIDATTRDRIAQSIKTSINLGEDQRAAAKRLMELIGDAARADMIAYTETVRAYATGRRAYADSIGYGWKRWYISNATDICADNEAEGPIRVTEDFISGDEHEPAHPNCQCQTRYGATQDDF